MERGQYATRGTRATIVLCAMTMAGCQGMIDNGAALLSKIAAYLPLSDSAAREQPTQRAAVAPPPTFSTNAPPSITRSPSEPPAPTAAAPTSNDSLARANSGIFLLADGGALTLSVDSGSRIVVEPQVGGGPAERDAETSTLLSSAGEGDRVTDAGPALRKRVLTDATAAASPFLPGFTGVGAGPGFTGVQAGEAGATGTSAGAWGNTGISAGEAGFTGVGAGP